MKTTIQINGLDVEFTDEVPTRAGAYWFKCSTTYPPELVHVTEHSDRELWAVSINLDHSLADLRDNLWSAPLVPVTEVRKAHQEGCENVECQIRKNGESDYDEAYTTSDARKVVEGCM